MKSKTIQAICLEFDRQIYEQTGWRDLLIQPELAQADETFEDSLDLVYLRERYYDPVMGRFLSLDPVEGSMSNPMSLNRYAYVHGDPVNSTDPSGKVACSDLPAGSAQRNACLNKISSLRQDFGITLAEETASTPETKDNWTSPRVNNVYDAVQAINRKLGGLTNQAIGGTTLLLSPQSPGYEAAITSLCDKIRLYIQVGGDTNHVHTVDNLIHEFGHVITLSPPVGRTMNSEVSGPASDMANRPVALWADIQKNRGFDVGAGWSNAYWQRYKDNNSASEVTADMFLYWVQGYSFDANTASQARSAFMNGGDIPGSDGNPLPRTDGTIIHSAGIASWAQNAQCSGGSNPATPDPTPASTAYVQAANSGWCWVT